MADQRTTSVSPGTDVAGSPPAFTTPVFSTPAFGGEAASAAKRNSVGSDADRTTDEWDASKVPPSRFQKRKGSIYATPSSRDGHVSNNYADKFHAKLAEMKKK